MLCMVHVSAFACDVCSCVKRYSPLAYRQEGSHTHHHTAEQARGVITQRRSRATCHNDFFVHARV